VCNDIGDLNFAEAFNSSMIENRSSELASVYNRSNQLYLLTTCARYDIQAGFKCINVRVWHRRRKLDTLCEINQVVPYDR
jgi:hypothetical protein